MIGITIKEVYLKANSPRDAFYILSIRKISEGYLVCKQSGANGKVYHKEAWFRETLEEAESFFKKKILKKTDPNRKSIRKYRVVNYSTFENKVFRLFSLKT